MNSAIDINAVFAAASYWNWQGVTHDAQIHQVSSEAGEVVEAWIRYQQLNPWKEAGPLEDVLAELADVAIAAMVGIARLDADPRQQVNEKLAKMQIKMANEKVNKS